MPVQATPEIVLRPLWDTPLAIAVSSEAGRHGGRDVRLLEDLFSTERPPDPLGRAADHVAGAMAALTGIAANTSFSAGAPIRLDGS